MALIPRAASSYVHYEQIPFIVFSIILMVVTLVSTCLGIYRRVYVSGKLLMEDVLTLIGTIAALALSAAFTIGVFHGVGKSNYDLNDSGNLQILRTISVVALYSYIGAVFFLRTSFLLLYLRFDGRRIMRWIVFAISSLVFAQTCSLIIGSAFSCAPPTSLWTESIALYGQCWKSESIQTFLNVSGIVVSAIDASILAASLSIPGAMKGLKIQRWAVIVPIMLGALTIAAGCIRCYFSWTLVDAQEPYRKVAFSAMFAQVEVHLALLCNSVLTITGLLPRALREISRRNTLVLSPATPWSAPFRFGPTPPATPKAFLQPQMSMAKHPKQRLQLTIPERPLLQTGPTSDSPQMTSGNSVKSPISPLSEQESPTLGGYSPRWPIDPIQELCASPSASVTTMGSVNFSRPKLTTFRAGLVPKLERIPSRSTSSGKTFAASTSSVQPPEKAKSAPGSARTAYSNAKRWSYSRRFPVKPTNSAPTSATSPSVIALFPKEAPQLPPLRLSIDSARTRHSSRPVTTRSSTVPSVSSIYELEARPRPWVPRRTNSSVSSISSVHDRIRMPSIEGRLEGQAPWLYDAAGKVIGPQKRSMSIHSSA